jgi:hypothetical protein
MAVVGAVTTGAGHGIASLNAQQELNDIAPKRRRIGRAVGGRARDGRVQCSAIRDGGQYVAMTRPTMFARGSGPQARESHEPARLSPST